jgi:hypothetical protein
MRRTRSGCARACWRTGRKRSQTHHAVMAGELEQIPVMFEHSRHGERSFCILAAEIGNNATDPIQEPQNRMLGRLAQMRLEFAEGQLDNVAPAASIASATPAWSISTISPRLRGRDKALLHIGEKHRPVHGSLEHKWCGHAALPQAAPRS